MRRTLARCLVLLVLAVPACGREGGVGEPGPPAAEPSGAPAPISSEGAVRFAAVGDIGDGGAVQRRVGDRIAALNAERELDLLLLLGDVIYPDGAGHRYDANFAEPWRAVLDARIPMAAALGNHDVMTRDGGDVMRLFRMPSRHYSIRRGPVTFFALDTNHLDTAQLEWLRSELSSTDTPWRVVFMHAPAHSSGSHGPTPYVQRALDPIAREFEIPLVLAGHDHDYERTEPIGGTVHIVAGTGCCVRPVGRSWFTAVSASEPGVVVADADTERLVLRFVTADGRVADQVTLVAPTGTRQPAVRGGNR